MLLPLRLLSSNSEAGSVEQGKAKRERIAINTGNSGRVAGLSWRDGLRGILSGEGGTGGGDGESNESVCEAVWEYRWVGNEEGHERWEFMGGCWFRKDILS